MKSNGCSLGDNRPKICKDFPMRQSDIDLNGRSINKESTCIAKVGGDGCNHCGQCCKDWPWPKEGYAEGGNTYYCDEKGICEYYTGV